MPNSHYARGAALERRWRADKEAEGYVTGRMAGSRGPFDCFAAKPGDLILAQMKTGGKNPKSGFGPSSRERLSRAAEQAGARAVCVWKGLYMRGYQEIWEADW